MLQREYLLYDLVDHKVFTSRDVKFVVDTFPFSNVTEEYDDDSLPMVTDFATEIEEKNSRQTPT